MNDQDDRQAPFWRLYKSAVMGCLLPEAHAGVSAGVMRAVWRVYADHADNTTHISFPARDRVAAICGFSTKQVSRAVAALVETGWLEVIQPARQHSSDVCRVIIQTGHHVLSEVYPEIQTGQGVYSEVLSGVSSEVYPEIQTGHHVRQGGHHVPQTGHHVPLTNITNKELVETRAHEPTRTTTPPEGRAESTPPAKPTDIDPAAMDGLILDMFDRYGRAMEIGIAGGLHHTLRDKGLSNRQVLAYLEERLIEFGVSDYDTKAAVRYIIRDAGKWLEDVTPPRRPEISQAQLDAEDAYDRQCAEDYAMIQSFTPAAKLLWDQAVQRTWERSMDGIDHPPEDLHALKLKLYAMSQEGTR